MIESILFGGGKGFGESILIKISEQKYGIIDSFLVSKTREPQVLEYLRLNNINPEYIDFVILTHYHQDHYGGIAQVLEVCVNARFFCPEALLTGAFKFLISAVFNITSSHNSFQDLNSIYDVLRRTGRVANALTNISPFIFSGDGTIVESLSPNTNTIDWLDTIYKVDADNFNDNPSIKIPFGKKYNFQSVVILIKSKFYTFLYGADLEFHETDRKIGWQPILSDKRLNKQSLSLFKVSHHGSENGFDEGLMSPILNKNTILKLTPYSRSKLPRIEMIDLFKSLSDNVYITSKVEYKRLPHKKRKLLEGITVKRRKETYGAVKVVLDEENIQVDLLGDAYQL